MAEISSRTGSDDAHFVSVVARQFSGLGAASQLDRTLGASDAALAVRDERKQLGLRTHPSGRPEFGQGLRPVSAVIRGHSDGLPDGGDPSGTLAGGLSMRQGRFGVVVEQLPGRHEVAGDHVGGRLVQGQQLCPDIGRELFRLDRRWDRRASRLPQHVGFGWMSRLFTTSPARTGTPRR